MSRCGETLWTLTHATHHSVEPSQRGGYWIPGRNHLQDPAADPFPPFTRIGSDAMFQDDLIMRVTEDGEIAESRSVARVLYESGLEPLLTATGSSFYPGKPADTELVHLNKIGELPRSMADAFPEFEAGDLILSLREHNLVLIVDPDTWRVKWHQTGPWRRQHDPEFNADGTLTVFNNNIYRLALGPNDRGRPDTPRVSNIVRIDPRTRRTEVAFGQREGQEFLTVIRGKHEPTPEGGFLITEFEGGRVFEVDAEGRIVWEYVNRYDDEQVLEITGARLYPPSYFSEQDWTCPEGVASR